MYHIIFCTLVVINGAVGNPLLGQMINVQSLDPQRQQAPGLLSGREVVEVAPSSRLRASNWVESGLLPRSPGQQRPETDWALFERRKSTKSKQLPPLSVVVSERTPSDE